MEHLNSLERNLGVIGTIAVIAPFVGLFGTVLGIIRAFQDIALKGNSTPAVVAAGVSEALITTAAGLIIAVIAVVFFNYFKSRIKAYNQEMIVAANQLAEMLHFHNTGAPIPTELYQPTTVPAASRAPLNLSPEDTTHEHGLIVARRRGHGGDQHHAVHRRAVGSAHHLHDSGRARRPARLRKELPNKNDVNQPIQQQKKTDDIEVDVNNKGVIFVDGKRTDDQDIYPTWRTHARKGDKHVSIMADVKAPYGMIIRILDAAKIAGLEDVGFVTS